MPSLWGGPFSFAAWRCPMHAPIQKGGKRGCSARMQGCRRTHTQSHTCFCDVPSMMRSRGVGKGAALHACNSAAQHTQSHTCWTSQDNLACLSSPHSATPRAEYLSNGDGSKYFLPEKKFAATGSLCLVLLHRRATAGHGIFDGELLCVPARIYAGPTRHGRQEFSSPRRDSAGRCRALGESCGGCRGTRGRSC